MPLGFAELVLWEARLKRTGSLVCVYEEGERLFKDESLTTPKTKCFQTTRLGEQIILLIFYQNLMVKMQQ